LYDDCPGLPRCTELTSNKITDDPPPCDGDQNNDHYDYGAGTPIEPPEPLIVATPSLFTLMPPINPFQILDVTKLTSLHLLG
jgi:hypothetical protein